MARAARACVRRAALAVRVVYQVKVTRTRVVRPEMAPWLQLTIFMGMHTLLSTAKGDVWVQAEMKI